MKTLEHSGYKARCYDRLVLVHEYYQESVTKAVDNNVYIWDTDKLDAFSRTINWDERILVGAILEECKERGLDVKIKIVDRPVFSDYGHESVEEDLIIDVSSTGVDLYRFVSDDYDFRADFRHGNEFRNAVSTTLRFIVHEYDIKKYVKFLFNIRDNFVNEFVLPK